MPDFKSRRAGLLFGSFIADALSLGVHWIYDTDQLKQKSGYVTDYHAPGEDSYHPHKLAGDQSHVGDQAIHLARFMKQKRSWQAIHFIEDWRSMWVDYSDYFDHATKTTLQNIENGKALLEAGSESSELAGPARIAPLIASLAEEDEASVITACLEQTKLTHASQEAAEATRFLAVATYRSLHGADFSKTLRECAPSWALSKADSVQTLPTVEAISKLGQSCSIEAALPSVIFIALKYENQLEDAFSENAMAGGDNCARALALGMLLGAKNGMEAIPQRWIDGLNATSLLAALLKV